MTKNITAIIAIRYIIFFTFFLASCQPAAHYPQKHASDLPRADSRFIGWLEKESVFNAVAEKIKIVSGTQFAWNFSASKHNKENILAVSPVWLQFNPYRIISGGKQSPLKLFGSNTLLLKKASIYGIYPYPTKGTSFESLYAMPSDGNTAQDSPISLSVAKEIGTAAELYALAAGGVQTAGNILPASLGTGADFLLALHGVREYPGLFMMLEIPKQLWDILPPSAQGSAFAPSKLSAVQLETLYRAGLIPRHFCRDFFGDFPESGFAASSEILGYDGVTRRWVYRYVNNPYTAVLNFYDPSFRAQRLISASIIEETGILKQGLVSVSVQDIWGQESLQGSADSAAPLTAAQPARLTLETVNRSVHGYGGWTFCRDPLPPALIKTVQDAETDFAADTLLMPALEQALLTENNKPLLQAFAFLTQEKIDEQSLWHGTPSCFSQSPYRCAGLTELIMNKTGISRREISMLQKMQESPVFLDNNSELTRKLRTAQNLHKLFAGFQSLLPGLNIIALEDMLGTLTPREDYAPFKGTDSANPLLFGTLTEQAGKKGSAADSLQKIWKFRQDNKLYLAKITAVHTAGSSETFALSLRTAEQKTVHVGINLSSKPKPLRFAGIKKRLPAYGIFWQSN